MSSFDPQTLGSGADPSSVPFWLPYQSPVTSNHTPQWTTQIQPAIQ